VQIDAELVLDREELQNVTLGDRQLMIEILAALVDDANRQAGMIEAAARANDTARTMRTARCAARACLNLGANAAAGAFGAIERDAAAHDIAACRKKLPNLRVQIDRLRGEAAKI
jgi:HPt (histidine-containing phosphotransfer) domain-containing protein